MLRLAAGIRVYVAAEPIDFRKAINGLAALVVEQFDAPVNDDSVYVFTSRDCSRVKCLFWDKNGFVLYQKRMERGRFKFGKPGDGLYGVKLSKKPGLAHQVVKLIGKLYHLESELKDQHAEPNVILARREQDASPVLAEIKKLLDDAELKAAPQSPLAKAIFYTLSHWEALTVYLQDGRLEIDNNKSERSIKPFVIGRKNWMFHGNDVGARAGSILFSLIETCKQNKVEVFSWIKYVIANIHKAKTVEQLEKLLPYNIDPLLLTDMRSIPQLIIPEK